MRKKISVIILAATMAFTFAFANACKTDDPQTPIITRVADERNLDAFEYTRANLTATDREGREAAAGDLYNGNDVGVFYHTWHGAHETAGQVLDITEILKENPDYLGPDYLEVNKKAFHWWGEPLYGYYCSDDPWVITRHIELMMAMDIDFLVYDYTNSVAYDKEADKIFEILEKYRLQGFKVPKVTFYTNTGSGNMILKLYSKYYESEQYKELWYAPNGKPLIIGVSAITCS
ncbi:MAG: hypothetical protein OSJ83_09340, partial [Clostridia bacterium]|nr:hypothetical protein [Clostridia bacterium]